MSVKDEKRSTVTSLVFKIKNNGIIEEDKNDAEPEHVMDFDEADEPQVILL